MSLKKKLLLPPDDSYHLKNIVKGLKFIQQFCDEKAIAVDDYPNYKDGIQNAFITHLKNHNVSIYNLFVFANFEKQLQLHDPDLLRFTLGDIYDNISVFRTKFLGSTSAKQLAIAGLRKIKKNLA